MGKKKQGGEEAEKDSLSEILRENFGFLLLTQEIDWKEIDQKLTKY